MSDATTRNESAAAGEGAALVARLAQLPTGVVWDVLRVMGLPHQALTHRIAGLEPGMRLCGPAFCIKGQTWLGTPPKPDRSRPQPRYALFDAVFPGCILVIDTGGYDEAVVMGENFAISATGAGCKGFVIDGAIRDAQSLVDQQVPTFVRFVTPVSSAGRWSITAFEVPISLPGQTSDRVIVEPGDFVLADRDGVLIVPARHAAAVVEYAQRVDEIEQIQRQELVAGKDDRQAIYERYDRFAHIKPVA